MKCPTTQNPNTGSFVCSAAPVFHSLRLHIITNFSQKLLPVSSWATLDTYKGYKCLNLNTNKICFSRHVTFDESSFPFVTPNDSQSPQPEQLSPLFLTPISISQNSTSQNNNLHQVPANTHPTSSSETNFVPLSPQVQPIQLVAPMVQTSTHHMITRHKIGSLKTRARLNLFHHTPKPKAH